MAIQMLHEGTASQQASAVAHFERRDDWRRVHIDGVRYIKIASSTSGHLYTVRADANGCDCPWYKSGHAICAHMLSVRLDIAERAAVEIKHQQALQDWLDDLEAPVQPMSRYQALYPSCWTKGCDNDIDPNGEGGCHLHGNVDAF